MLTWPAGASAKAHRELVTVEDGFFSGAGPVPIRRRWAEPRFVVQATPTNGIRSIGGWQLDDPRRRPTISQAKRNLGEPTSLEAGRHSDCVAAWRGLDLSVTFVHYESNRPACKAGVAQSALISDPWQWAVIVGKHPGIIESSQPNYLVARQRAEPGNLPTSWTLATRFVSGFTEPGDYPAVEARGLAPGPITSYELSIGADDR